MSIPRGGQLLGLLPLVSFRMVARSSVIGLAVVTSGCAAHQKPSYVNGPSPHVRAQQLASVAKDELEDDGKPAQTPPLRRALPEEDDPSQPWSPNYGGPNPSSNAPANSPPRSTPKSRTKTYDALTKPDTEQPRRPIQLTQIQQDDVITRAISVHEMRNQ
jgi:hypothetical protein